MLSLTAPAKVNLALEVLGRRPDGYHEIRSLIQTIELADTLSFEEGERLLVNYEPPWEPEGDLVLRSAAKLWEVAGEGRGAVIRVQKRVPVAFGLGGGSSDAAATLLGLNRLWSLGMSREELLPLASEIGSDVAFFLYGGTALVEGRGEKVMSLPSIKTHWLVLLCPSLPIMESKTAHLYQRLTASLFTSGKRSERLARQLRDGAELTSTSLFNVFESVVWEAFPGLERYKQHLLEAGAETVHLAGSGPALFSWEAEAGTAARIQSFLQARGLEAYLARTI